MKMYKLYEYVWKITKKPVFMPGTAIVPWKNDCWAMKR